MSRQFSRTAAALAVLASGLLTLWNAPLSAARQSPDVWSAEHRAVLPSGLSVRIDAEAAPGTAVTAEPGELADRTATGSAAAAHYTDGTRPGDSAQTFAFAPDRPQADGSWHTVGTLRLDFSQPVRNPRLHLSGLAALATGASGSTSTAARLTLTGGSPAAPSLVDRTDWSGWTVDGNVLAPASPDGALDGDPGSAAEGSLELAGTVRTAVFRIEQRSVARAGSTTAPPALRQAYTVTVDEGLGTAPQDYGNASHVVSDLSLGADATGPARTGGTRAVEAPDGGPLVRLDRAAGPRTPFAGPQTRLQPGRGEYRGADPSLAFPTDAAIGRYYRLTVPVAVGDRPATLAGWIDFGHTGRFDPTGRVQTEIPPGADTATLEWTVPPGAASGETWARLRIGRDGGQLVSSGGFADSGQVTDQLIQLIVGAARPEIAEPVDGAVLADARPRISGGGAVSGATVEVREGDTTLCEAKAGKDGAWSCRPGTALAAGPHALTPVETTGGGVVLRGEPVKVGVKTVPPGAPTLTVPAYTNDPGLRLGGTGEAGSTVSVVEQGSKDELCITGVPADGRWSCLPVENLTDGKHLLTPVAVDVAGNRTTGTPVELVVDTGLPERPVLTAPAPGETLRVSRPKLAGRADPDANVLVTARAEAGTDADRRTVLCGATAALDGSWSCTANRDLTDGEHWLIVTATDRAGNEVSAEPVRVRVDTAEAAEAAPVPVAPSPSGASPAVPSVAAQSPAAAGVALPSPAAPGVAVPSPSGAGPTGAATAAAGVPAAPTVTASAATASTPAPSPTASSVASSAAPRPSTPAGPSPSAPGPAPAPSSPAAAAVPAVLPIVVPPVAARPVTESPVPAGPATASAVTTGAAASARASGPATAPSGSGKAGPRTSSPAAPTVSAVSAPSSRPVASTSSTSSAGSTTPPAGAGASPVAVVAAKSAVRPAPSPTGPTGPTGAGGSAEPDQPAEGADRAARPLAAPPAEAAQDASGRPGEAGWRGGLAGALMVLTGLGLIARRVLSRRSGAPRR